MIKKILTFSRKKEPPTEVECFEICQKEADAYAPKDRGIRTVALERIVGSIGRYKDFDSHFRVTHPMPSERLNSIREAMRIGKNLGPVKLYQIKDSYYVLDGNHRIAATKELGHDEILARVIELAPSKKTHRNLIYYERSEFLDRTQINADINLSEAGQYDRLLDQIVRHHHHLQQTSQEADPGFADAARDWYKTIYRPLCTMIQHSRLIDAFPKRTVADLYAYISHNQWSDIGQRRYGIGLKQIIPTEMEAFREKMADLKSTDYPEMKREITAFVLMHVQAKREYKLVEKLYALDEVKEVHSVHGDVDLLVKIELARDLLSSDAEVISLFVHENIGQLTGVKSTKTLIPGFSRIKKTHVMNDKK